MSKRRGTSFVVSLALLFLAPAVIGQEADNKMPVRPAPADYRCESNTCVNKVFYFANFSTRYELQDIVNTFRTVLNVQRVSLNESEHAVSLQGTPEEAGVAEKLVNVLERLRSSGGHKRFSVVVYEPLREKVPEQPAVGEPKCELTSCFIEALYLPDLPIVQLQDRVNKLHSTMDVKRISMIPPSHVIIFQGTSKQLALAEGLMNE